MKKLYSYEVKAKANRLLNCKSLADFNRLDMDTNQMILLAMNPPYYTFEIRKKGGGFRAIEAPELSLKTVQSQLNAYLQCVYFMMQSKAAYGYIIRVKDVYPYKNILSNARQHLGAKYLLNADFKDFFHQVTAKQIRYIFQSAPFGFSKKLAHLLTKLVTREGRLPMGAPTSPALSNLATIALDQALMEWTAAHQIIYTRFVDDLTFSSKEEVIHAEHFEVIQSISKQHGFHFNVKKIKFFSEEDSKKVTGLLLNSTIDIDPKFYRELDKNLKRLRHIAEASMMLRDIKQADLLRQFKQEVDGMVNFIGMIEGYDSPEFRKYRKRVTRALEVKETVLSVRWTNSNYF